MDHFGVDRARLSTRRIGGVAQLGERLLCKQEVIGSIPFTSTILASYLRLLELELELERRQRTERWFSHSNEQHSRNQSLAGDHIRLYPQRRGRVIESGLFVIVKKIDPGL